MDDQPYHPTIGNRWIVVFLLAAMIYPLSYAPWIRFADSRSDKWVLADGYLFYRPVDWAYDNTPLRRPLLWWADRWGVGDNFAAGEIQRLLTESAHRSRSLP